MALIDFLMTQECTIIPWVRSASGEDIYGEPETRKCRIEAKKRLANTTVYIHADGVLDSQYANAKMFCTGAQIPNRSKVVCDDREFIVVNCYPAHGFIGSHLEVDLE